MFGQIFNILPDWMTSLVVAAFLWFGINYIWLAPSYFSAIGRNYKGCQSVEISKDRTGAAIYTSTLGFIEEEIDVMRRICRVAER